MSDTEYMKLAIKLAKKGAGYVNPNPMVGAVIVKDNRIIGQGYHEIFGGLHAERNALKNCRESPVGATLYVTLDIVNIGLHFFLKNVRPYAASCSEA